MGTLYVTDTNALIYYFQDTFEQDSILSGKAKGIISEALCPYPTQVRLSIPSVVFVEIFEKWLTNEEFAAKFHYEVFLPIKQSPNIEIKPIEREVVECILTIGGDLADHELHDKVVLASAIMLNCPLITTDQAIIDYVKDSQLIPSIIN